MASIDNTRPPSQSGIAGIPAFPSGAIAITPSDADTFLQPVAVYVGATGNVAVTPASGGANVTFVGLPAGAMVPCMVRAVLSTGTTATSLIGVS
jgi:hypothetical protein